MNIFFTDNDPFVAASNLDDRRCNKMIIESAQMLSTCLRLYGVDDRRLYKIGWQNHPSTMWARQSDANFEWLALHGLAMCAIYSDNHGREHKTHPVLLNCLLHAHIFPSIGLTSFANCSLVKGDGVDVIEAYRYTMNVKWAKGNRRPTWKNRGKPEWYRNLGGMV